MKLFLASEAKHPKSMAKLNKFVGDLNSKSIAYIPTAANGEEPYGSLRKGGTWNVVNKTGAKVTPVVLEENDDASVKDLLKDKDIIWFAGGMCGYLMYWVRRREIDKYLKDLLKKGSVYVGSSAGSMTCAKTLDIAEAFLDEVENGASILPGHGLIDFDIYPHYENQLLPVIKKIWSGGDLYLLKNGEVIIVADRKVEVLGKTRILRDGKVVS